MASGPAFDLSADEIVRAAVEILRDEGLDAVSMRTVAGRLGVSPVPLYSRVGNKEALLDAIADRILADTAPPHEADERWQDYAMRWSIALRDQLTEVPDIRKLLGRRRTPFFAAARALVGVLAEAGFSTEAAIEATQLISWTTISGAWIDPGLPEAELRRARLTQPGSENWLISREQSDHLFRLLIRYIVEGTERAAGASR